MARAFLQYHAPNGMTWEQYCRSTAPQLDGAGLVSGPWGECMHHAVQFELSHPNWSSMPEYMQDGPCGQVVDFLMECGHSSMAPAMERLEETAKRRLKAGDQMPAPQPPPGPIAQGRVAGGVPHHPGAPGSTVVVGVPLSQRAQAAISGNALPPKASPTQITSGAQIVDASEHFPENRPCRDLPFAICFALLVVVMIVVLAMYIGEIPKMVTRAATEYEVTPDAMCGNMEIMTKFPDGKSTAVTGIQQRLTTESDTRRLTRNDSHLAAIRSTTNVTQIIGLDSLPLDVNSVLEVEFPGLSEHVRKLQFWQAWGLPVSVEEEDADEDVALPGSRRLSNRRRSSSSSSSDSDSAEPVVNRDCERACSAFTECGGFQVIGTTEPQCVYYKMPSSGTIPDTTQNVQQLETSCWTKVDTDTVDNLADSILVTLLGLTIAGGCASMVAACGFVNFAAKNPSMATYCGVYFVPGCMIFIGFVILVAFVPIVATVGLLLGLALICCGGCLCACTHFCYRDLIPLTIEVIACVSAVIMKFWSMLCVAACGAIASILWSFICATIMVGMEAASSREAATTPASQVASSRGGYLQTFVAAFIYFWGGFIAFNACHVAFCGVFGRWYFGKEGNGVVAKSITVAFTTSFGSVCLGSLIIAIIRAMEAVARKMQQDAQESGNTVACVVACIIKMIISCIGDILEWISLYVYVQVAIRGLGFMQSAKATYALATVSNLIYVVACILCEWVVFMGTVFAALCGGMFAGFLGYMLCGIPGWCGVLAMIGCLFGCIAGCAAGGSAVGVINSGSATILMCWAERPDVLEQTHRDLHDRFNTALDAKRL